MNKLLECHPEEAYLVVAHLATLERFLLTRSPRILTLMRIMKAIARKRRKMMMSPKEPCNKLSLVQARRPRSENCSHLDISRKIDATKLPS